VDPAKIQFIRDWPTPTTPIELCSFLALANFYRRFVLGFSHITWPLSQVTKGGAKEKSFFSESQQKAFEYLKHRLCSAPVLTLPDLQQHLRSRHMPQTMILGQSLLNRGIRWRITVRHSPTQCGSIQLMTKRCNALCRLPDNGSITFWERKRSSTQTTDPCSSYRHKGSCRMIAIRSGPHTCNSSI
jgi:hypothetical protein